MTEKEKTMSYPADEKLHIEELEKEKGVVVDGKEDYSGAIAKTDPEEIALVRKLDWRIMPTLWCMYFLNYLDRNAIAQARLNDLEDDLDLHGSQYNTAISILFVGYLLMQIPSNMFMSSKKVRPSIYMGICMGAWAVVSACTALVAEAPFYPGALFMLSLFYTRKEIATRISILYSGNILATAFSGLIAAAVFGTVDGAHGLKGWRWLFIIEGILTFSISLLSLFTLADHPLSTRWLTPRERELAHARIARDTVSAENDRGARAGFMQAIRDPRLYLFCFMQNMHLSACGFNNFFPTVVETLGFNSTITLVLTCPPYLVSGAVGILVGWTSGRYNERTWHVTVCMGAAVVGFVIACATLNTAARYIACFLFASGAYAVNSVILGWVSATLGQTSEKKGVSLSVVNVVANASYIYTAYLYPKSDGPRYVIGMGANAGFAFATIASAWVMRVWLMSTNKKIREGRLQGAEGRNMYAY
ncbi:putative vitamin h transporter protein [Lasiodiplodia theobromae]|nr:putative vitamin h transporter protein [Lasiodiplodia theobromae]